MSCMGGKEIKFMSSLSRHKPVPTHDFIDKGMPSVQPQIAGAKFAPYLWEQTVALLGAVVQQLASNWLAQGTVKIFSGAAESNQVEVTLMTFAYALLFWVFINRGLFKIRERARSFTEHLMVVNRSAAPLGKFRC
jgi:hypothetical protein